MSATDTQLTKGAMLHYALLAFPIAFAGMPLYVYAPDFYVTTYGISLTTIGSILLVLRMIDAVQDPLIGHFSDIFSHKRLPIMLVAALTLVGSFYALFAPPQTPYIIAWFVGCVFLATTSFSILAINLNTLGGLWGNNSHDKTRIAGFRESIGLLGLLIAVSLPAILHMQMSQETSFLWLSGTLAFAMIIALSLFAKWMATNGTAIAQDSNNTPFSLTLFRNTFTSVNSRFLIIYGLSMLASSFPAVLLLFFIRDLLGAEELTGLFLTLYFLSGAAAMPLWNIVSKTWGKRQAWICAMVLAVLSFIWVYWLGAGDIVAYAIICVVSGIALGADLALPPSILADNIENAEQKETASLQYSFLTFLSKVALAIASLVAFALLDYADFQASLENSAQSLHMLSLNYGLIPCLLKLIAAILLWRTISQENHHEKNTSSTRTGSNDYV